MPQATYVAFVPKSLRDRLRWTLQSSDTGDLNWREQRISRGSEFYFTGPPDLARRTHAYIVGWVAAGGLRPTVTADAA
jgi:hypothetical protein